MNRRRTTTREQNIKQLHVTVQDAWYFTRYFQYVLDNRRLTNETGAMMILNIAEKPWLYSDQVFAYYMEGLRLLDREIPRRKLRAFSLTKIILSL